MIIVDAEVRIINGRKVINVDVGSLSQKEVDIVLEVLRGAIEYVN